MITFMDFYEKLMECVELLKNTPSKDHHVVVTAIHQTLAHIPEWLDTSFVNPTDPLLVIYENYDTITLKYVNQQYFTVAVINRAGKEVEITLPTIVAEKGIKWYRENVVTAVTKEFLREELRRVANMMQVPDRFSKEECIKTLHSVLEQIPEWKDASVLPPACPLLTIYDNYDDILIGSLSDQFFTLVHYSKFKNGACCALPYSVAEIGMKMYFNDVTAVEIAEQQPEPPSIKPPTVRLGIKKLDPDAQLPHYAHEGDAGMDVFALEDVELPLYVPTMVHTGIAAEIPDGYELQVRPRSGLSLKGVTVWNSPGTVDSKYRGEICIILMYINNTMETVTEKRVDPRTGQWIDVGVGTQRKTKYNVKKGDKIAQLVLAPVTFADTYEVQELSTTDRGTGGFGSTGR